ncbi:MAG TPA: biotin transporter BioY [Chlamydiales bacterium]|nr:biotin transporter BioY [Chlamydiales bacterium]
MRTLSVAAISLEKKNTSSFLAVIVSSILIGLFANVTITLPFTPIPITTQGSVILILACCLGAKRGGAAVLCFLFQGMMGLPVFAGGAGGMLTFFGPTCGYRFGYLAAAVLVGYLTERMTLRSPMNLFFALLSGNAVIFLFGVSCFAGFVGLKNALLLGFFPFIIGDILKLLIGIKILTKLQGLIGKYK